MSLEQENSPSRDADEHRQPGIRELSDARTMRALAHPVRLALIDALKLAGPLTATQAGERIGESPTTCSFHLRQLAKYGFVEEAGGGSGRARPWRLTVGATRFTTEQEDPETRLAAGVLERMLRERNLERYRTWLETRTSHPKAWRENALTSQSVLWMTVEELAELNEELLAVLDSRFQERKTDPAARPEGARPVELQIFSYPLTAVPRGESA
jgi:DNA-binding transcriptional ArsR family regulator